MHTKYDTPTNTCLQNKLIQNLKKQKKIMTLDYQKKKKKPHLFARVTRLLQI